MKITNPTTAATTSTIIVYINQRLMPPDASLPVLTLFNSFRLLISVITFIGTSTSAIFTI
ncbi:hypothetical protein PBCV1_a563R [Paramecium bursaria Chlorella virus 1]|uniref:Uncharacterized protein n=1 Tax=Paramecium bursaria Chlorella virus 1 TaxID=10506 RepID=F8TU60_PBCV1|nr:hypothetical protein PBCV1_a563R [Paramecium bursaria Chlorella virus 1]AEI70121.1 hypothetical protein [Paramecium bursaria Chlorella virus 1]